MASMEERVTILETEFRTELRHLATKADLEKLRGDLMTGWRGDLLKAVVGLAMLQVAGLGATAAIVTLFG